VLWILAERERPRHNLNGDGDRVGGNGHLHLRREVAVRGGVDECKSGLMHASEPAD
jgi:hypothetical protein